MSQIRRPSAICVGVTLLSPMWRALPLKFGQNGERRLDRPFGRPMDLAHDPEVDDLERVEPEMAQIVVDRTLELGRGHRRDPRCVPAAPGADLGDDDEMVGIRMERLADQMVGVVGPIIVAGVDMIDAAREGFAQHRDCAVAVPRRPCPKTPFPASCIAP